MKVRDKHKDIEFNKTDKINKTENISEEKPSDELIVFGRNPVYEAIVSERCIDKLFVLKGERQGSIVKILGLAKEKQIVISEVEKQKLDMLSMGGVHQGVVCYCSAKEYSTIDDMLDLAKSKNQDPFIIICDEINDPHNLGAIIRTANAVCAHGVIIPKRRSVGLSSVVSKSAAGALEYVKVARVPNLVSAIEELKQKGLWIYGADIEGKDIYFNSNLKGSIALVIGSEGQGMSRLVKSKCDVLLRIPMLGEITSLNASVAGSVLMYEVVRQRSKI